MSEPKDDWNDCLMTVVTLPDEDFDRFMNHMVNDDHTPTLSIIEGAKQLRELYRKRSES